VIKNVYNNTPTIPANPIVYKYERYYPIFSVLFKYREGTWKACREKINSLIQKTFPEKNDYLEMKIFNLEEEYDKLLKSENIL
jgi:hypothetical protein